MPRIIRTPLPLSLSALAAIAMLAPGAAAAGSTVSKAEATAYAHEVNLTAADYPGARVSKTEQEAKAPSHAAIAFARCAGAVNPNRRIVDVKSVKLGIGSSGPVQVSSSVEVMPTAALMSQTYSATASARGRNCLAKRLPALIEGAHSSQGTLGPPTLSTLPNPLGGGKHSFGTRIETTFTETPSAGPAKHVRIIIDIFEILAGPAEVGMSTLSLGRPVSRTTERRLLSVLYDRAQAHKL